MKMALFIVYCYVLVTQDNSDIMLPTHAKPKGGQ